MDTIRANQNIGFNCGVPARDAIDEAGMGALTDSFNTGQFLPGPDRFDA